MKIGIVGVGHIGKTLAMKLAKAGHDVFVAGSSGPEKIHADVLATGAQAVTAQQAVQDKDVIILSIPLNRIPEIAPLFASVSEDTTVIDTSNYYPARDLKIDSIEAGQVESLWVVQQLGHSIAKAWNAIGSHSLVVNGKPAGSPDRIAIPIAADRDADRELTMKLVDDTGFDAFNTGSLANSWRQQPGAPAYCTDLTLTEIQAVIDTAEKDRLPKRRDLVVAAIMERMSSSTANPNAGFGLRLSRALYM
ncbi:NAD(P)-binding domain-containing protein [Dyadobacter sp. LJ53]|uniref:NADPH-dependent F420 reductase n=1 Tax=Dyadobacter chenwenxiniae TaxID=2906456 RepID=UPI001F2F1060|nr:NAD(P)-binding domain-containing protein [Dyadobacter chenwenxiniae]MCF0051501.1 NAD(P)-binding domain-containing protein [Dyadobacter chenwenxiniae]